MGETPKLIVLSKNLRGQSFKLDGDRFVVGRTEDSDITLVDSTISTHHADVVKSEDGSFMVCDKGSTNGTRVNGTKISEQVVTGGDVVQFGGIELLFDDGQDTSTSPVTQTAFDITKTAGTIQLSEDLANMNPFADGKKGGSCKSANTIFYIIITVLLVAIAILGWKVVDGL